MIRIHGIKQCDTMKKALSWLDEAGLEYYFHDYRKEGVPEQLDRWIQQLGWEVVINRRGTSWRKLPQQERDTMSATTAALAARENPALIKRPLVEYTGGLLVGFAVSEWQTKLL